MDTRDYKTLQILEEIESNSSISQRRLSEKLNMSLGLVNSFVKHLTAKGYFRAKSLPKRRVKYILTPEGASEKTKLVYDYIRYSFDLYKQSYAKIHDLMKLLEAQNIENIAFFGVSTITEIVYQEMNKRSLNLVAVVDDLRIGELAYDHHVIGVDDIGGIQFEKIIVTAYDHNHYSLHKLKMSGIEADKIVFIDN